jgi:FkbM family methyltransferase
MQRKIEKNNYVFLYLKYIINTFLKKFDLKLTKNSVYCKLLKNNKEYDQKFLNLMRKDSRFLSNIIKFLPYSESELRQDLFVLNETNFKRNGYFIEFGLGDGKHVSNTYLLEKKFNWKGIVSEPAKIFHNKIKKNRRSRFEKLIIWKDSNVDLIFKETLIPETSCIKDLYDIDDNKYYRKNGKEYSVKTISLNDLLKKYKCPKNIDYLSIDTEGSELDILSTFNFNYYNFKVITVEHNYNKNRKKIYKLLNKNGYSLKYKNLTAHDDWYINNSVI